MAFNLKQHLSRELVGGLRIPLRGNLYYVLTVEQAVGSDFYRAFVTNRHFVIVEDHESAAKEILKRAGLAPQWSERWLDQATVLLQNRGWIRLVETDQDEYTANSGLSESQKGLLKDFGILAAKRILHGLTPGCDHTETIYDPAEKASPVSASI